MSKRHRWAKVRFRAGGLYAACSGCLMRRRWRHGARSWVGRLTRTWEYLPANTSGWEHAQRLCGPCPGEKS